MHITMFKLQFMFSYHIVKGMIVIPTGEGKDRPSLSPIPVAYVYVLVYVYIMLIEIC